MLCKCLFWEISDNCIQYSKPGSLWNSIYQNATVFFFRVTYKPGLSFFFLRKKPGLSWPVWNPMRAFARSVGRVSVAFVQWNRKWHKPCTYGTNETGARKAKGRRALHFPLYVPASMYVQCMRCRSRVRLPLPVRDKYMSTSVGMIARDFYTTTRIRYLRN